MLFTQATVGHAECNLEGLLLKVNDCFCSMLGRSREDLLGRHLREIVHPDDLPGSELLLADLEDGPSETDSRYLRPDGSVVSTRTVAELIQDDTAQSGNVQAVCVDIIADHPHEYLLCDGDERFRLLANAAPGIVWIANAAGEVTFVNDRWHTYTGCSKDEAASFGWTSAIHPEDLPPTLRIWQDVRAAGVSYEVEIRYRQSDGAYRWHLVRADPYRHPATQEVVAWFGHATDIHSSKMMEAALRESEQRVRATYEHAAIGIAEFDTNGRFLRVNEKLCEITGYGRDELLVRTCHSVTFPDDRLADLEQFRRMMAGEFETYSLEQRYVRKSGDHVWVAISASRVDDEYGQVLYGIKVVRDISARKRAEESRRLLVNELNHRVKNTLATVQSIARQTLRNASTPLQAEEDLESRLLALSRTHDVLTSENWEGARLSGIVNQAIAPYLSRGEDRFHLSGPDVYLNPQQALAIAMAAQELATNAAKYGSLSNDTGQVAITWSIRAGAQAARLLLSWIESNGPPVAPPTRRGFGTRLIERSLARELQGTVEIGFAPEGVVCRADIPLRSAVMHLGMKLKA
jgi:PAS domain S-box-containing protein